MKVKRYYTNINRKKSDLLLKNKIKRLLLIFPEILYSGLFYLLILIRYFMKKIFLKKKTYKYEVSICAIFKNEAKYMKEWIEFHKLIGVDHIYLYNNNSTDNYKDILFPYLENKYVTLTEWPMDFGQRQAYQDCYERFKNESHWIGYIDLDEFVNLRQKDKNIKSLLKNYTAFPALYIPWRMFGTSGYIKEPDTYLVIEKYSSCWDHLCNTGKSFINCDYNNFNFRSVHYFSSRTIFNIPFFGVSEIYTFAYGCDIFFSFIYNFHNPKVYINHYWSKAYEWYQYKDLQRGDASSKGMLKARQSEGRFELHELQNTEKDYSIQRFLIPLKLALKIDNEESNGIN